jgi:cyclic pyranopterin phosphate synthase
MVDVGAKAVTRREAVARGSVSMSAQAAQAMRKNLLRKGDALATARLAGIMAAKRTHELIPLCHQVPLDVVEVELRFQAIRPVLEIEARVATSAKTGVEMEALVAVSAAALCIYDMAKAVDREMTIGSIRLVAKRGGRSGEFTRTGERGVGDS